MFSHSVVSFSLKDWKFSLQKYQTFQDGLMKVEFSLTATQGATPEGLKQ